MLPSEARRRKDSASLRQCRWRTRMLRALIQLHDGDEVPAELILSAERISRLDASDAWKQKRLDELLSLGHAIWTGYGYAPTSEGRDIARSAITPDRARKEREFLRDDPP